MIQRILFCCAIMALIQLQGCMYQTLNHHDIKRGEMICEKLNSEVHYMSSNFVGDEFIACTNGNGMLVWSKESSGLLGGE